MKITKLNPYGLLSEKLLRDFENQNNIEFPKDYRIFLLTNNGGQPEPSFFWIHSNTDGSSIHQFFGLHNGPVHLSLKTYIGEQYRNLVHSIILIADDGMGNFLAIGIDQNNYGEVFFIDHDLYDFQSIESMKGITKISNSFSEFLNSLIDDLQ